MQSYFFCAPAVAWLRSEHALNLHQPRGSGSFVLQPVEFHATATFEQFIRDSFCVYDDEIRRFAVGTTLLAGVGHGVIVALRAVPDTCSEACGSRYSGLTPMLAEVFLVRSFRPLGLRPCVLHVA